MIHSIESPKEISDKTLLQLLQSYNIYIYIYIYCSIPCLALLFSHFFMLGNNIQMFENITIAIALCVLIIFSVILFIVLLIASKLIQIFIKDKWQNLFLAFFISIFSMIALHYFLFWPILIHLNIQKFFSIGSFLLIFVVSFFKKEKFLFIFLFLIVSFSFGKLLYAMYTNTNHPISIDTEVSAKFTKRPNIYLFILESYHRFDILKSHYGIKKMPLKEYLGKHQFSILHNSYSDSESTLKSMIDLYSLGRVNTHQIEKNNFEVTLDGRMLISGNANNIVFKTFKRNGYITAQIFRPNFDGGNYYTINTGKYLDINSEFHSKLATYIRPLFQFSGRFHEVQRQIDLWLHRQPKVQRELYPLFRATITKIKKLQQNGHEPFPYFMVLKGGAEHTLQPYSYLDRHTFVESNTYQNWVLDSDYESCKILDWIMDNDPDSMIVILGDHGSHLYRPKLGDNAMTLQEKEHFPVKTLADDWCGVLMAIRMPGGADIDISAGKYMSHVNIFTHIFAWLADDKDILNTRTTSQAKGYGAILVKDGKILEQIKPIQ